MEKLITMTEFVISQNKIHMGALDFMGNTVSYAQLLQTPLSLSQFIPCKQSGELAENPEGKLYGDSIQAQLAWSNYKGASDRVLFEGWEINVLKGKVYQLNCSGITKAFWNNKHKIFQLKTGDSVKIINTTEDLINSGIELIPTDACRKIIGV